MNSAGQSAARRRPLPLMAEINAVPYIDVMLVLLVVFVVAAPLLTQGVEVELPSADAEALEGDDQEPVIVSVDKEGKYYLNVGAEPEQALELSSLEIRVATLLRNQPGLPVLVRADRNIGYGVVIALMAALQKAGVPNVGLITQTEDG